MRRNLASRATDDALVGLACDENLWVRREAARNPATPPWVLDLLMQAGADADLRGRRRPDPTMASEDLRRLVECGPWAQRLVADHPNTPTEVLSVLAAQPSTRLRAAVAGHLNAAGSTLADLCADGDAEVRRRAAANPGRPDAVYRLLRRAGSDAALGKLEPERDDEVERDQLLELASLGPWGLFLAARRPGCPDQVLASVAADPDWKVRSALLDNHTTPDDLLERVTELPPPFDDLRPLANRHARTSELLAVTRHQRPEVRLACARHPNAPAEALAELAADRSADVRRLAAQPPNLDRDDHERLVRAGSSKDLSMLADPDPELDPAALERLARGGHWARQLAVRHPGTAPDTLSRLLCDSDGKLREWAAAHPSAPRDVIAEIRRAGGAVDFQGIADPDPEAPAEMLQRVANLGPWGAWVVSWHPNTPTSPQATVEPPVTGAPRTNGHR
jgi:hypothetical protein